MARLPLGATVFELIYILIGAAAGFGILRLLWADPERAVQALIHRIFTATNAPILVAEDGGRVLEASHAAAQLLGRDAEAMPGSTLQDLLGRALLPRDLLQAQALELPGAGKAPRQLEARASRLNLEKQWVIHLRDLSALRWAESVRQRDERFFRSLLEHALDGVAVLDRSGELSYHSPSAGARLPLNASVFRQMAPQDQPRWRALLDRLSACPGVVESFEFGSADGSRRFEALLQFNPGLEHPGYIVNYRDLSQRKPLETP